MRVTRIAVVACAAWGLSVQLGALSAPAQAPVVTAERQYVMGGLNVESANAGQVRITFWLNTPTYLAKKVVLESGQFAITRASNGAQTIESAGPVSVTGFRLERQGDSAVLLNDSASILVWDQSFKLPIHADGTPAWPCCPQK
jgi:hypothetical protein